MDEKVAGAVKALDDAVNRVLVKMKLALLSGKLDIREQDASCMEIRTIKLSMPGVVFECLDEAIDVTFGAQAAGNSSKEYLMQAVATKLIYLGLNRMKPKDVGFAPEIADSVQGLIDVLQSVMNGEVRVFDLTGDSGGIEDILNDAFGKEKKGTIH